ncbi:hypothetical protein [Pseudonocardia sp.]|uniref:hypothetical protein n=1 Tax=Pseudonocardia sp. TaxID=60912 RepID=UPI003D13ADBD
MTYVTVVDDAPVRTIANLEQLMAGFPAEPDGLVARYAGTVDGKLCIVAVWDSREDARRFLTEELPPALGRLLGPEPTGLPQARGLDVEHSWTRDADR